jgi:lactoylglutathione lyase
MTLNNGPCTVYYMAYYYPGETTGEQIFNRMQKRDGLLELVHIHGSEGRTVQNGNPPHSFGFGHIGISVPDIEAARQRFIEHGVEIWKDIGIEHSDRRGMTLAEDDGGDSPLTEGFKKVFSRMMMIRDPDGALGKEWLFSTLHSAGFDVLASAGYFIEVVPYGAG